MKEIEQFATQFRRAIDLALEAGEFDNDSIYRRFPRACCGDTSDLLAQYLLDKGIKTDYVCGTYWGKPDGNGQSHAWLMVDKYIIIDITLLGYRHLTLNDEHSKLNTYILTKI